MPWNYRQALERAGGYALVSTLRQNAHFEPAQHLCLVSARVIHRTPEALRGSYTVNPVRIHG